MQREKEQYIFNVIQRALILILSGCFLSMSFAFCSKQRRFKKITLKGVVVRSPSRAPVAGREVRLEACGKLFGTVSEHCGRTSERILIGSTNTGADGSFEITGNEAKSNWYFVVVAGNVVAPSANAMETNAEEIRDGTFDTVFVAQ